MRYLVIVLTCALAVGPTLLGEGEKAAPKKLRGITIDCPGVGDDRPPDLTACGTTDDADQPVFGVVIDPTNGDQAMRSTTVVGPLPTALSKSWKLTFTNLPIGDGMILRVETWQGAIVSDEVVFNVVAGAADCVCPNLARPAALNRGNKKIHAKPGKVVATSLTPPGPTYPQGTPKVEVSGEVRVPGGMNKVSGLGVYGVLVKDGGTVLSPLVGVGTTHSHGTDWHVTFDTKALTPGDYRLRVRLANGHRGPDGFADSMIKIVP